MEAERRCCGDNSIVTYVNATFYPKQVADVTTGTATTAQSLYNPIPKCGGCCNKLSKRGGNRRPRSLNGGRAAMTVTIDQAMRGAMRYADNEVIPHLPGGKGIGAGIMLALIMEGSREKVLALRENPAVKMMQIFDDAGNIDLDKLYNAARPRFENKLTVSVPLLGDMRFDQNDVDKLYRYIQEA